MKKHLLLLLVLLIFGSCSAQKQRKNKKREKQKTEVAPTSTHIPKSTTIQELELEPKVVLPEVSREFRAVWIATVANIDWPSRNNLSVEQQKQEAIYLLDVLKNNNFNAVVFQARPSADAFYKSDLEPWSYFLTGKIGQEPFPYYDPLEFWITEAHERGLEFHVWLNPFRAHHSNGGSVTNESMVNKMPNEILRLRNGMYWYDPSNHKTQDHVSLVVKDILNRYEVDGIHFDDYFYPYKEYNYGRDFPDEKSWKLYQNSGGTLSKPDWRRSNVNHFVERIYKEIKATKNSVKFGISPFGIWKSGFPEDVVGTSQYDEIFADAKLWLNEGWMDYYAPQLYWKEEGPQRFSSLLKWWQSENTMKRHLWPGLNTVAIKNVTDRPTEIVNQVNSVRQILTTSKGEIHYSIAGLIKDYKMQEILKNGPYQKPALVPKTLWLKSEPIETPQLFYNINEESQVFISWRHSQPKKVRQWVLYAKYGDDWETEILSNQVKFKNILLTKNGKNLEIIALKAVDKLANESSAAIKIIKR